MAIMFFAILGGRDPYNSVYIILIYIGVPLLYCTMLYFRGEKRPSSHSNWNTENDTVPLKDFAEQNGKMQVYNYIDINGKEYSKCVFTKETSVTFSVKIGWLTAAEISANKDNLVVKRKNDGTLELTKAEGATIKHFNETPPPLDAIAK